MELKGKSSYVLYLKSVTWYKDSHSLFDYESSKVSSIAFNFPLHTKTVALYRKRQSCDVVAVDQTQEFKFDKEAYQFLTKFQIQVAPNSKLRINFLNDHQKKIEKPINSERLKTDESISSVNHKEEETYIIVRKQKQMTGQPKGYKLEPGQTIKLGRVEYFVSEICIGDKVVTAKANKEKVYANRNIMKYSPTSLTETNEDLNNSQKHPKQCKICLEESEDAQNFLFNPCKCSGSCGTVHLECLLQWIHVKVKKQVVGGTLHYNFEKFECEICKTELPMVIDCDGKLKQMLPIEKPQGSYLILEGACQKSKSVMMIKNVPEEGIKLGRGHECEIRITDISVSRNHAFIKNTPNGGGFYIYDNKSKFGTLVKEEKMNIELANRSTQGIQVGRTVVTFDIRREKEIQQALEKQVFETEQKIAGSKKNIEKPRKNE